MTLLLYHQPYRHRPYLLPRAPAVGKGPYAKKKKNQRWVSRVEVTENGQNSDFGHERQGMALRAREGMYDAAIVAA